MNSLERLVIVRAAWDQRGELIAAAKDEGFTWDEIAEATKLSRMTVINLRNETRSSD